MTEAAHPLDGIRFVAFDTETTGFDARKDRIVTIGAIGIRAGEILLQDTFEALIRIPYNTSAVTVHGVTRQDSLDGIEESEAMPLLTAYLRDAVIVGHHFGHDIQAIDAALLRLQLPALAHQVVDTMDLTLWLERDGAFSEEASIRNFSLDALCHRFGVPPHDRHTAAGDAYLTAQVFQRLYRLSLRHGRTSLATLCERFVPEDSQVD